MNRITVILLLLMLFLGGLAYFLKGKAEGKGKMSQLQADRNFSIEDEADIYEIHVQQQSYDKLILKRNQDHWRVNDEYRADENIMHNLLKVLVNAKVDFIPQRAALSNIKKEIDRIGIRVQVFDKKENKLRDYHIGANTNKEEGTFFLMHGSDQAYTMVIPGLSGSLRSRFQLTESKLRDRYIFRDLSEQISSISMVYPTDKVKGFKLIKQDDIFMVEKMYSGTKEIKKAVNQRSADLYFKEFDKMSSESFENENENKADIVSRTPFGILTITMKDGGLSHSA